jgi:SAM-dependent methyltransferase
MNILAQNVSKEVFSKYAANPTEHTFILSSIFDYVPAEKKLYDIVHCRGVLSHTSAKEDAFQKIAGFLKPGGFLIFGDPNKAGGFQNMLQRHAVYKFAKTPDEMVDVSEFLFKEDIDRSERAIPRTRRAIIFDRWVIQSQDDPSVAEVVGWAGKAGLKLYSSFPAVTFPLTGDSLHHRPVFDPYSLAELFTISELSWMMQSISDAETMRGIATHLSPLTRSFEAITRCLANTNKSSVMDSDKFHALSQALRASAAGVDILAALKEKLEIFSREADEFVDVVAQGSLQDVREFIEGTRHLFRGACGNRHVDFIAYKPTER